MNSRELKKRLQAQGIKVKSVRSGRGSAYGWFYITVESIRDLWPAQNLAEQLTGKYGKIVVEVA